jgi:hypothetical protein
MYVEGFGGHSPEKYASTHLRSMFTFVACRVILSQLAPSGRGDLGSYNSQAYDDLMSMLENEPLNKDPDAWIAKMLRKNEMLAMRIMEVRAAYVAEDFEWDILQKLAIKETKDGNVKLMRQYATDAFAKASVDSTKKDTAA